MRRFNRPCSQLCPTASFGIMRDETSVVRAEQQPQVQKLVDIGKRRPGKIQGVSGRCPMFACILHRLRPGQIYSQF